jgi:hypothetical protein
LGVASLILIPSADFPVAFLAFFEGVELAVAFHLPAQALRALAPALTEGSLIDSSSGGRAETGMVGIEMSPSKPGMGEMKLSKACIQTNMMFDSKKAMKYDITGAPYRVPLNPNMVGSHLLVGWPAGSVLEYLSYMLHQEIWSYIFLGLLSRVLGSTVLPTQMDMFLQLLDSAGQPMCGHADSRQSFFPSKG